MILAIYYFYQSWTMCLTARWHRMWASERQALSLTTLSSSSSRAIRASSILRDLDPLLANERAATARMFGSESWMKSKRSVRTPWDWYCPETLVKVSGNVHIDKKYSPSYSKNGIFDRKHRLVWATMNKPYATLSCTSFKNTLNDSSLNWFFEVQTTQIDPWTESIGSRGLNCRTVLTECFDCCESNCAVHVEHFPESEAWWRVVT